VVQERLIENYFSSLEKYEDGFRSLTSFGNKISPNRTAMATKAMEKILRESRIPILNILITVEIT